jgi:hypothetical protein
VQPNPADYFVAIHYEGALATNNHRIQVFSPGGSLVETINVSDESNDLTLYVSNWDPGTYLVVFRNDTGIIDADELVVIH